MKGLEIASSAGPSAARRRWWCRLLVWGLPCLLLAGSYLQLAVRHRTWNLLDVVIHEGGRYTFLQTVFYVRHFARELIPSLFIAGAVVVAFQVQPPPERTGTLERGRVFRLAGCLGVGLVVYLAATQGVAVCQEGWKGWLCDLLQFRTRDDRVEFGTHWQYHFLHLLDSLFFCVSSVMVLRGLQGSRGAGSARAWPLLLATWLGLFGLGCAVFGPVSRALVDPLYLGHQLREIVTHRLLGLPLAFGVLLALEDWLGWAWLERLNRRLFIWGVVGLALSTLVPLWLYWRLGTVDLRALAPGSASILERFTSHTFEHVLDTVFICGLSAWLQLTLLLHGTRPRRIDQV